MALRERKGVIGRPPAPRRGRWSQAEIARLQELYGLRDDASIARELNRPVASVRKMAQRVFETRTRTGPWTAREVTDLKRYLGATTTETIALVLGRSEEEVRDRITELGRVREGLSWGRDEIAEFKRIYGTRTDDDLARIFGRAIDEIRSKATSLALRKDKAFVRRLNGEASTRMPRWSKEELELLRERYPSEPNLAIAQHLGRSVKSVVSKAHNLGLKKSPDRLRQMGRENVSLRYGEDDEDGEAPPSDA